MRRRRDGSGAGAGRHRGWRVGFVGLSSRFTAEIAEGLEVWRDRLGCEPGEPTAVDASERVTRIGATCRDGREVVRYDIEAMGHAWPKEQSHGIGANQAMWGSSPPAPAPVERGRLSGRRTVS